MKRYPIVILMAVLFCLLVSCGGNSTGNTLDTITPQNTDSSVTTEQPTSDGAIPQIPRDVSSDGIDPGDEPGDPPPPEEVTKVVLGSEFLLKNNAEVDGTTLVMEVPDTGEDSDLAWGMYKVSDIKGLQPQSISVETIPGELGDNYWVGVANYTVGAWDWFGPAEFVEYEVILGDRPFSYVTRLGNMYFILLVEKGNKITHQQSTILLRSGTEPVIPGAPYDLRATDGEYDDKVVLEWEFGANAEFYEIWRRDLMIGPLPGDPPGVDPRPSPDGTDPGRGNDDPPPPPSDDWYLIGLDEVNYYEDYQVIPGYHYEYRVRSVNRIGHSGYSNIDEGWAFESGPPPADYAIYGHIDTLETMAPEDIGVTLLGPFGTTEVQASMEGDYRFDLYHPGIYIVFPTHPHMDFTPIYGVAELTPDAPEAMLNFVALNDPLPTDRIWGFAYSEGAPGTNEVPLPIPGAAVHVVNVETEVNLTILTNDDGFFMVNELPAGPYVIEIEKEDWGFIPDRIDMILDGETVAPPVIFYGFPFVEQPVNASITGIVVGDYASAYAFLLGYGGPITQEVSPNGMFLFDHLHAGQYIVGVYSPDNLFEPQYFPVLFSGGAMEATVTFSAGPCENPDFFYGFLYLPRWDYGYHAVPQTEIIANNPELEQWSAFTNEWGFFIFEEMPNNTYTVDPNTELWTYPETAEAVVDGLSVNEPLFFLADDGLDGGDPPGTEPGER